jgi:type I restriction enzyme R subunit
MARISEYEVENLFIERLESIGYEYVDLANYDEVLNNFKEQLTKFNKNKLLEKKGKAELSKTEFERVLTFVENKTVYESAKILRDKYILSLDNGETVYLDFFSADTTRNLYQVAHQITMDKNHKDDVDYKNRYDVTVLINGLPLVQIELKRPGVEINEAINQINRYRKFSYKGLFRYLHIFVVSNSVQTKYFCNENEIDNGQYNPILKSLVFFWTDEKNIRINSLNDFTAEFFRKTALTEMIDKYMVIKTTEPVMMVMRPYQIFAVKEAKKRILESNQNGYVFACTGSGKTLTSFKLAQLLREEARIDKVVFLIDRKDLDDQTVDEYNSFEKDCVDSSDSTYVLVKQLKQNDRKLLVTTIQKMANAVRNPKYASLMDNYKDKKVVYIIDECHRSQFGKMHGDIKRHFEKANYIGFTGTPIFEANKGADGRTTADIFNAGKIDPCLHKYMIKDAIADGNVLRFSVEYQRTIFARDVAAKGIDPEYLDDPEYCRIHNIDINALYHDDERIHKIAKHIMEHHEQHVHLQRDIYTALFAVDNIKTLGKYYDEFKKLNEQKTEEEQLKVAAIFTYQANEDMDEGADEHSQELLSRCMNDYNQMYGTSFSTETFDAYRKDIAKRLKQKDLPQVDVLLVVNMFLTGFDAKPLNTLYLDKNLIWHTLVQAYSRTNRVHKSTKQFGQIVSYRNIKKWQDDALRLFSGDGDPNEYLLQNYEYYVNQWINQEPILRKVALSVDDAGQLQNEEDIRKFIIAFRSMTHTLATLKTFSKFDWEDLAVVLGEEEYDGYKSWYLYYYDQMKGSGDGGKVPVPVDVDFDIELVRTDRINVVYILNLLKSAKDSNKSEEDKQRDIDLILRDIERSDNEAMRYKSEVMKAFIKTRFFELPVDSDIMEAYTQFERESLQADIEEFAYENNIKAEMVSGMFSEYTFSGQLTDESIRVEISYLNLGLLQTTRLIKRIKAYMEALYKKYKAEGE